MKTKRLTEEQRTQRAIAQADHLRKRAIEKLARAVNTNGKTKLSSDEANILLLNIQALIDAKTPETVLDDSGPMRAKLQALSDQVTRWRSNVKERKTLPKTLEYISEQLTGIL